MKGVGKLVVSLRGVNFAFIHSFFFANSRNRQVFTKKVAHANNLKLLK